MNITNNIIPNTQNPQNPKFNQLHTTYIVEVETGEVLEEFNYNFIYWSPFIPIFEKYQKQHMRFDVIRDGEQLTKLFRRYQKTPRGSWIKKSY